MAPTTGQRTAKTGSCSQGKNNLSHRQTKTNHNYFQEATLTTDTIQPPKSPSIRFCPEKWIIQPLIDIHFISLLTSNMPLIHHLYQLTIDTDEIRTLAPDHEVLRLDFLILNTTQQINHNFNRWCVKVHQGRPPPTNDHLTRPLRRNFGWDVKKRAPQLPMFNQRLVNAVTTILIGRLDQRYSSAAIQEQLRKLTKDFYDQWKEASDNGHFNFSGYERPIIADKGGDDEPEYGRAHER